MGALGASHFGTWETTNLNRPEANRVMRIGPLKRRRVQDEDRARLVAYPEVTKCSPVAETEFDRNLTGNSSRQILVPTTFSLIAASFSLLAESKGCVFTIQGEIAYGFICY
jgi:hypothetical protein